MRLIGALAVAACAAASVRLDLSEALSGDPFRVRPAGRSGDTSHYAVELHLNNLTDHGAIRVRPTCPCVSIVERRADGRFLSIRVAVTGSLLKPGVTPGIVATNDSGHFFLVPLPVEAVHAGLR